MYMDYVYLYTYVCMYTTDIAHSNSNHNLESTYKCPHKTYTCAFINMSMHMHIHMNVCIHMHVNICAHTCMHTYMYSCTHKCRFTCLTHICMHTCMPCQPFVYCKI